MAGMKVSVCMVALMVVCMAAWWPKGEGALSCVTVVSSLKPCLAYVQGKGGLPPGCCTGVQTLNGSAKTTADRQVACNCLKTLAKSMKGINYGIIEGLPGKCGVNVPYKISPDTDCTKVH
ncbi:Plant non-specific lipid-transfer protein/Par allergen protein [Dioscorea alata]|uniref:Plant non-specific lipid-transfer protein/Par allergen protein n=1 Tax=Dioscorea alata TaxID=55571 RepID=A0ACB7VFR5_DIOAL|nr:Plant non-specific lipid-transfer protein/Par allergen protein [Dioscorea alata]